MAGLAVLNVIGLVSGVVGIWGFAEDHIPAKAEAESPDDPNKYITTLRVVAGLDGTNGMTNAGGNLESIFHYNNNDEVINTAGSSEGSQPVYTEITASLDNICIALMSTTWPDGSQFGWTGDWANICGLPSYYSGIIMPNGKSPACMWVDGRPDKSHQAPYAIKLKWHDFLSEDGNLPSESEAKGMCGRSFRAFTANLNEITLPANRAQSTWSGSWKREHGEHMGRSDDRLIVSSLANHNATELCSKPNSYGPDFVSLEEKIYCNMETRETLPLCDGSVMAECFDVETTSHVARDGSHRPSIRARNPTQVIRW